MAFDPLSAILDVSGKLIDRLWPDPTQKAAAALEILKMQQSGELAKMAGQMDINKSEASSASLFVAGWRPYIGWICGTGLGYQFLIRPLLTFAVLIWRPNFVAPSIETAQLIELLVGMLGLGAMRTYEKVSGIDAGH